MILLMAAIVSAVAVVPSVEPSPSASSGEPVGRELRLDCRCGAGRLPCLPRGHEARAVARVTLAGVALDLVVAPERVEAVIGTARGEVAEQGRAQQRELDVLLAQDAQVAGVVQASPRP